MRSIKIVLLGIGVAAVSLVTGVIANDASASTRSTSAACSLPGITLTVGGGLYCEKGQLVAGMYFDHDCGECGQGENNTEWSGIGDPNTAKLVDLGWGYFSVLAPG